MQYSSFTLVQSAWFKELFDSLLQQVHRLLMNLDLQGCILQLNFWSNTQYFNVMSNKLHFSALTLYQRFYNIIFLLSHIVYDWTSLYRLWEEHAHFSSTSTTCCIINKSTDVRYYSFATRDYKLTTFIHKWKAKQNEYYKTQPDD